MNKDQLKKLEADLWRAADSLRANSDLKASEYSTPVLGLIFLKFADNKYRQHEAAILAEYQKLKGGRLEKKLSDIAIERCGFYLPDHAGYGHLLQLPEKYDMANALKKAMQAIEEYKPELAGVLPQDEYFRPIRSAQNSGLAQRLLKIFSDIPQDAGGDLFGKIYEYFLANFALSEGQGGGEFFTPRSVVKRMVEFIEHHGGKVFDPACVRCSQVPMCLPRLACSTNLPTHCWPVTSCAAPSMCMKTRCRRCIRPASPRYWAQQSASGGGAGLFARYDRGLGGAAGYRQGHAARSGAIG